MTKDWIAGNICKMSSGRHQSPCAFPYTELVQWKNLAVVSFQLLPLPWGVKGTSSWTCSEKCLSTFLAFLPWLWTSQLCNYTSPDHGYHGIIQGDSSSRISKTPEGSRSVKAETAKASTFPTAAPLRADKTRLHNRAVMSPQHSEWKWQKNDVIMTLPKLCNGYFRAVLLEAVFTWMNENERETLKGCWE